MAWRMLVRRCPTRSFTIVGDVAQTSSLAGARSWKGALDPVFRDAWRLAELTVNYRTPAAVADAARRAAVAAGLPVSPLTSAREVPDALRVVAAGADVAAEVRAQVEAARAEFVAAESGRVAVVAAAASAPALRTALGLGDDRPDDPVVVLDPVQVKGLEFDAVVLVEPADVAAGASGASDLYVAMTRPTQRLVIVHARALPAGVVEPPTA